MGNFLVKFLYTFSTADLRGIYEQLLTCVFDCVSNQNNVQPVILTFCFDLVAPFYFLNEISFSQPLYQSSVSHVTTSTTYYH